MSLFIIRKSLPHYEFVNVGLPSQAFLFEASRTDPIVNRLKEYCKTNNIVLRHFTDSSGVFEATGQISSTDSFKESMQ